MKKSEQRLVTYCDVCGAETSGNSKCWGCGKDVCPQHQHLVDCDHFRHTYVCDDCRKGILVDIDTVFNKYSSKQPK